MKTSPGRKAFLTHLTTYLVVNGGLLALNILQTPAPGEPRQWWALWPLGGWGIALAAHGFSEWAESRSRKGQLLADPDVRGFAVHLFLYLAVNILLIGINLTITPESQWFIWPLLGWGAGLAVHAFVAYRAVMLRTAAKRVAAKKPKTAKAKKTARKKR